MEGMFVAELWRYPVKSMRGESLDAVEVRSDGVVGDRLVQVVDGDGLLVTARTRPDRVLTNSRFTVLELLRYFLPFWIACECDK